MWPTDELSQSRASGLSNLAFNCEWERNITSVIMKEIVRNTFNWKVIKPLCINWRIKAPVAPYYIIKNPKK